MYVYVHAWYIFTSNIRNYLIEVECYKYNIITTIRAGSSEIKAAKKLQVLKQFRGSEAVMCHASRFWLCACREQYYRAVTPTAHPNSPPVASNAPK